MDLFRSQIIAIQKPKPTKHNMYFIKSLSSVLLTTLMYRGTNGFLKGSSSSSFSKGKDTKGRGLSESFTADASVKVLDSSDCGIELGSGYEEKFIVLGESMNCDNDSLRGIGVAITISAPGMTLDCKDFNIQKPADNQATNTGVGIRVVADNIFLKNCDISGFEDGIHLGQHGTISYKSIHLSNINSHDNTQDGLDVRSSFTDVTVVNSQFNDNDANGFDGAGNDVVSLTNLFLSAVEANGNGNDGFELKNIQKGLLIGVTTTGNTEDGLDLSPDNGPLSIQASTFCDNGKQSTLGNDIDGSQFSAFSHHSITCDTQAIGIDDICDCPCP